MDLSYHSTSLARQCPMKYKFSYIDKLEPIDVSPALSLGKVIHDAFELFYRGKDRPTCLKYITEVYDVQQSKAGPENEEKIYLGKCTALGMFANYPNNLMEFSEISPEVAFSVSLDAHNFFKGRVDGIVTQNGKLWIREVKTTGLSMRQFEGRASVSYQSTGYLYGVQKTLGKLIMGVMYDILRKPALRKRVDETKEMFGQRIMDFYANKKNHKYLFRRHYAYRTPDDIARFEQDLIYLSREMWHRVQTGKFYRNTDSCWSFNNECHFRKICFADEPDPLVLELYFRKRGEKNEASNAKHNS